MLPSLRRVGSSESSEKSWPSAPDVRGAAAARSARASRSVFPSADAMSRARTEATSAGRMLPIAKSTAVSQRNSLSESRLSVMACRPSAGFCGAGTSMRDTSAYFPSTHAPCVSSNRTSPELRVHTRAVGEHSRGHQRALRDLQPRVLVFGVARDVGVSRAERPEQLLDVRDRARTRPESGERVATAGESDEQRERERGAPSSPGATAACREGTAGAPWRCQGLKRHPTTGILHGFPEWSASRRIYCPLV